MKSTILTALFLGACFALENRLGIGGGLFFGKSNLSSSSKAVINDLGKPDDSFIKGVPIIDFNLNFPTNYGNVFLRSGINESPSVQAGIKGESLEVYAGISPIRKVWKDPYLQSAPRAKTRAPQYEAGVSYRKESYLISFRGSYTDVKEDLVKERYPKLARDNLNLELGFQYLTRVDKFSIGPRVILSRSIADGDANSYTLGGLSLDVIYRAKTYQYVLSISAKQRFYDSEDPIFNKIRRDTVAGINLSYKLLNFPAKGFYVSTIAGALLDDSNIGFYDSSRGFLGATLGYRW
ncbi:MAG: DUF2860 domain-containing protein [Aquificaceae bacterium]|nr:DUF2860 domain-containing protein [Aquificaceae bacterium]MDW8237627.1 DUF2860 family protein [Aquificaceae bacterium]